MIAHRDVIRSSPAMMGSSDRLGEDVLSVTEFLILLRAAISLAWDMAPVSGIDSIVTVGVGGVVKAVAK